MKERVWITRGGQDGDRRRRPRRRALSFAAAALIWALFFGVLCGCSAAPEEKEAPVAAMEPVESVEIPVEEPDADQASVEELLGYVRQAEALVEQADAETEEFDDMEDPAEKSKKQAEVSRTLLERIQELQTQAGAVRGADRKLKAAVAEYFTLTYDSQNALMELRLFFADYFTLYGDVIAHRPANKDYPSSLKAYYTALDDWYQSAKDGYKAITTCPDCLKPQWKKYGEILDLNDSISYKLYLADVYGDNLRMVSAMNMSDRYETAEELQYEKMVDCLEGERAHFREQGKYAYALAKELHAYAEMTHEERADYAFENIYTGRVLLSYDTINVIYPSLYNSYDAFLVVKTGCVSGTRKILVEAEIPGLTQKYRETFNLDSAYKAIYIMPPPLTGDLKLTSSKSAQISLTVSDLDGTLIAAKTFPITLKSKYDFEWYSDEYGISTQDNILCFMAPESEAIAQLKRQAIEEISSMTGGQMKSFVGYQNNKWDNHYVGTYLQAAGLMRAMYETGVRYNMDTFSISGSNQHILLPDDVLRQRNGLCIETSLVMASALQSAGMHVFLVFPPGHAQVAVEVWDGTGSSTIGTGQYLLIETTALSDNWESAFKNGVESLKEYMSPGSGPITYMSQNSWYEYITKANTYLIDCDDSSTLGMTPFAN